MQLQTNKQSTGEREGERGREGGRESQLKTNAFCISWHILAGISIVLLHVAMQSAIFVCTSRLQFIWLSASLALLSRCLFQLACLDIFPLISVAIQLNLACLIYLINFFSPSTLPQSFFFSLSISFYFTLFMFFFLFSPPLSSFPSPSALKNCPPQRGRNRFGIFI